jgi:hypothetical protein
MCVVCMSRGGMEDAGVIMTESWHVQCGTAAKDRHDA